MILGLIADAPSPFDEDDELYLNRQLLKEASVPQEYLQSFLGLVQDLGIVEYCESGLIIASPVVGEVLRERRLYPQAAEWLKSAFFEDGSMRMENPTHSIGT